MKRRSLVVHATVIAGAAVVAIVTAMLTAPVPAVVVIAAALVAVDVAALLVVNRLEDACKTVDRLNTRLFTLRGAASDVRSLAAAVDPAQIRQVETFISDVDHLLGNALKLGQEGQS